MDADDPLLCGPDDPTALLIQTLRHVLSALHGLEALQRSTLHRLARVEESMLAGVDPCGEYVLGTDAGIPHGLTWTDRCRMEEKGR